MRNHAARLLRQAQSTARVVSKGTPPPQFRRGPGGLLPGPTGAGLKRIPNKYMGASRALGMKNGMSTARGALKGHGKLVAGGVAGAYAVGGIRNRTGRPADRVNGRPTGPYQF